MIDYWSKLKLDECWSKKTRFNMMMNYIMGEVEKDTPNEEPTVVEEPQDEEQLGTVSVSVKDEEGKGIANADVSIYDKGEPYEGTTGSAGGCTIRGIPYGEYTIEAVAEGYDFTVETISIESEEVSIELILKLEVDDDV